MLSHDGSVLVLSGLSGRRPFEFPRALRPSAGDPPAAGAQAQSPAAGTVVYAYYFHQTFRCLSCQTTEEMAARAIQEHFARQIQEGQVVWMPVNIDKPEGKVLRQQFDQLNVRASDLVLARMENGVCKESKKLDELCGTHGPPGRFREVPGRSGQRVPECGAGQMRCMMLAQYCSSGKANFVILLASGRRSVVHLRLDSFGIEIERRWYE